MDGAGFAELPELPTLMSDRAGKVQYAKKPRPIGVAEFRITNCVRQAE